MSDSVVFWVPFCILATATIAVWSLRSNMHRALLCACFAAGGMIAKLAWTDAQQRRLLAAYDTNEAMVDALLPLTDGGTVTMQVHMDQWDQRRGEPILRTRRVQTPGVIGAPGECTIQVEDQTGADAPGLVDDDGNPTSRITGLWQFNDIQGYGDMCFLSKTKQALVLRIEARDVHCEQEAGFAKLGVMGDFDDDPREAESWYRDGGLMIKYASALAGIAGVVFFALGLRMTRSVG